MWPEIQTLLEGWFEDMQDPRYVKLGRKLLADLMKAEVDPGIQKPELQEVVKIADDAFSQGDWTGGLLLVLGIARQPNSKMHLQRFMQHLKTIPEVINVDIVIALIAASQMLVKNEVITLGEAIEIVDSCYERFGSVALVQVQMVLFMSFFLQEKMTTPAQERKFLSWFFGMLDPERFAAPSACTATFALMKYFWERCSFASKLDQFVKKLAGRIRRNWDEFRLDAALSETLDERLLRYAEFNFFLFAYAVNVQISIFDTGYQYIDDDAFAQLVYHENAKVRLVAWNLAREVLKKSGRMLADIDSFVRAFDAEGSGEGDILKDYLSYACELVRQGHHFSQEQTDAFASSLERKLGYLRDRGFVPMIKAFLQFLKENPLLPGLSCMAKYLIASENQEDQETGCAIAIKLVESGSSFPWMQRLIQDAFSTATPSSTVFQCAEMLLIQLIMHKKASREFVNSCKDRLMSRRDQADEAEKECFKLTFEKIEEAWQNYRAWGPWLKNMLCCGRRRG